jgi:ribosomal-protein-alanine N-acetyltransferase
MSEADLDWVAAREAELHAYPWSRGNFADAIATGNAAWIMKIGCRPVAYAVVLPVLDEAHLLNISVVGAEQGVGLGRALLEHLFQEALRAGGTQFFLEVRPSNQRARALYRSAGFHEIGRRRGYYPAPDGREDAIVMKVAL